MPNPAIQEYLTHLRDVSPTAQGDLYRETEKRLYRESLYLTAKYLLGYSEVNWRTHGEMIEVLESASPRKMIIMPRGTFKTSLAVVAYPIWRILKDPNIRIMIDSELFTNAARSLREIRTHLQQEKITSMFGGFVGGIWNDTEIQVAQRTVVKKEPTVMASGIGAAKTGVHVELIIADDLCSPHNMNTPENRNKVHDHYAYYTSILEPGGTIVVVGTRYSSDDLYARILAREIFLPTDIDDNTTV